MYSPFALTVPLLVVLLQPTLSATFSWQFTAPPTQCSNLAISIVGSDGQPPYRVLIIPSGPTPLANNIEVRLVIDQPFAGDSTSVSFPINYPANSHFVAVVSDAHGFGTGGAGIETMVANSDDRSCFDTTKSLSPYFQYGVGKDNQLTQCQSTFVWWDSSNSQGTVSFVGVIPGGQSFKLPESNISTDPALGKEFTWIPDIQGGTTLLIVCGDNRGMGTGGSGQFTVQSSSNTTCLNSGSPSSTPGVAAGSLQTTASTSRTSSTSSTSKSVGPSASANNATDNGGGGPNVGVIVPAAIGGIVGLFIIIAFIAWCWRTCGASHPARPVSPLLSSIRQVNGIATSPEDRYEPPVYPTVGTYNHEYVYSSGLPQTAGLTSVKSGGGEGNEVYDTFNQRDSRHLAPPPSSSQGAKPEPPQNQIVSGLASAMSGGGGGGGDADDGSGDGRSLYDMSSRAASRQGAPLVTSKGGPSMFTREDIVPELEEPPPAFTP